MIPIRLQIKNFMNHRDSDIDCTLFNSALIVAKDKNNDRKSNGIGKTTIYSAIEYVLFGQVPTSILDEVVRDGAEKCEVIFDFSLGGKTYRILRGRSTRGRSELRFWEWGGNDWHSRSERSMPETNKKIQNMIKISHKAFTYCVKYAQRDLTGDVWAAGPEDRQTILKEPLNLSPYTRLEKIADLVLSETQKKIEKVETAIQTLGNPEDDIKIAEADLQYYKALIASKKSEIEKSKTIIDEMQQALNDLKKSITASDYDTHNKIDELQKRSQAIEADLNKAQRLMTLNQSAVEENKHKASSLGQQLESFTLQKDELDKTQIRSKETAQAELDKVSNDELYGTSLLAQLKAEYDAANKHIPNGDICTYCQQPISPDHRHKFEQEITSLLEEKSKLIRETEINLGRCKNKKRRLQEEINKAEAHKSRYNSVLMELTKIQTHIDLYAKNVAESSERLAEAKKDFEQSRTEHEEVLKRLLSLKETMQQSSLNSVNTKIIKLNDEIRVYEHGLEDFRREVAEAQARFGAAEEKIKIGNENLQRLKDFRQEQLALFAEREVHQLVVNAFSHGGIPTFIIHSILDELQMQANKVLQDLRPELEISFDKDLNMGYKVLGRPRTYKQLSIGQNVYILLSLKMGLAKIIQHKIGIDIRFLLLDEVDQSLDKEGVDAFSDVIKRWQNEFKIFVITHNDVLKDKFSHTILIEGDGLNGASSRVVTSW